VHDLLQNKRVVLTALFAKIKARDPIVFPAWEVLRMATIEGAQAIGLGASTQHRPQPGLRCQRA
jgi:5-methylthioadenosine/S-adenosylhomocysteine deaminase